MDAIVLFSHGSVVCGAERTLLDVAARMRERGDAPIVEVGFLNYNEPSFDDAVRRAVAAGATRILVAPWFLVAGKFVVKDLPLEIDRVRGEHPGLTFTTADVIGFHARLADAVLESAAGARPPAEWRAALTEATRFCRQNPKCPLHGQGECQAAAEVGP